MGPHGRWDGDLGGIVTQGMGFIGSVPFRTVWFDITESLEILDLN